MPRSLRLRLRILLGGYFHRKGQCPPWIARDLSGTGASDSIVTRSYEKMGVDVLKHRWRLCAKATSTSFSTAVAVYLKNDHRSLMG